MTFSWLKRAEKEQVQKMVEELAGMVTAKQLVLPVKKESFSQVEKIVSGSLGDETPVMMMDQ